MDKLVKPLKSETPEKDPTTEAEKLKYERIWAFEQYRLSSPGLRNVESFFKSLNPEPNQTVADLGCGTGKASRTLRQKGLKVRMLDITETALDRETKEALLPGFLDFTEACLWELPKDFGCVDWVYCCDVMEHLPEEKVDQVLLAIQGMILQGGFLSIATYAEGFGKLIDDTLHLTVKDAQWWVNKLSEYFRVEPLETTGLDVKVLIFPKA